MGHEVHSDGGMIMRRRLALVSVVAIFVGACSDAGQPNAATRPSAPAVTTAAATSDTTTQPPATASTAVPAASVGEPDTSTSVSTTQTPDPAPGHFSTLPPGSALPTDARCASEVRPEPEIKDVNIPFNARRGVVSADSAPPVVGQPVTGDFTGTTDEIMQWAACKWGIDEDIVRAQMAKETGWRMDFQGDFTPDQTNCHVSVRTTDGSDCPEALGISQIRPQYHPLAYVNDNAVLSTAYNVDYAYSKWRSCYEGLETWLNTAERGSEYGPGDQWGCVGLWFSGRWHTEPAEMYIAAVQEYLDDRVWTSDDFPYW